MKMKEEDREIDLEGKPQIPPEVLSGATAGRSAKSDLLDENPMVKTKPAKAKPYLLVDRSPDLKPRKTIRQPSRSRTTMKAPGSEDEDRRISKPGRSTGVVKEEYDHELAGIALSGNYFLSAPVSAPVAAQELEKAEESWDRVAWDYNYSQLKRLLRSDPVFLILKPKLIGSLGKPITIPAPVTCQIDAVNLILQMLRETGFCPGAFEAKELMRCSMDQLTNAADEFVKIMVPLVGKKDKPEPKIAPTEDMTQAPRSGSSPYISADSEIHSDDSISIRRMSLGPSGGSFLRDRMDRVKIEPAHGHRQTEVQLPHDSMGARSSRDGQGALDKHFNAAMKKFLDERQREQEMNRRMRQRRFPQPQPESPDVPDVDMESVASEHVLQKAEYDPDDLWIPEPRKPQVATIGDSSHNVTTQRIRVSAISELKEFSGKDRDEDRARSWIGKVKSAFLRDQAPEEEKCLVFGDLMVGPARYWYRQLSRSTRFNWKDLSDNFLVEYAGHGVSLGRQYYHAKKRPDETPLEYLRRLNVMGMQAKIPVKSGSPAARKEHVDHFIDTLDDHDLAGQLLLLRVEDVDAMELTLREYQRGRSRHGKAMMGSSKYRQKVTTPPAPSKPTRAVRVIRTEDSSSESESNFDDSESEDRQRSIHATTALHRQKPMNDPSSRLRSTDPPSRPDHQDRGAPTKPCTHCGSTKHGDLGCWKRLTCQKCGRKGHPSDNCFFVCRACGEMHDPGKCPMEEFYNMIRKWYVPTKHAGMLPEKAEKMLN